MLKQKNPKKQTGTLLNYDGYMGTLEEAINIEPTLRDVTLDEVQRHVAAEAYSDFYRLLGPDDDGYIYFDFGSYVNFYVFVPNKESDDE